MRLLVTGGSGFVGTRLVEHYMGNHEVAFTFFSNEIELGGATSYRLDVRNRQQTATIVEAVDPDVVVHAAALVNADRCEREPALAEAINVDGTRHVIAASESVGADVAFLSSSFVFSGSKDEYHESDARNPVNFYGETKVQAEDIVFESSGEHLVIRLDQPYGWSKPWQSPTMVEWVLESLAQSSSLGVFADWSNNPTYIDDVVAMVGSLIEARESGVFHCVGDEFIDRYTWACKIADRFGKDTDRVRPANSSDADLPAERPNANLSNQKVGDCWHLDLHSIDRALSDMYTNCPSRFIP